ncbi:hypothetical protein ABFS82_07G084200 [Erythranthe guttata]|uniref:F-box domain-containing protein n=1 Tax=Erythranthe guttata TaxID=4155 RepID=A0A022S1V1_ERYGU|nr:PREDICTED: putative F-box/LRR-repeat protein At5g02700 [Erythranthe guttata]EYU45230.1 hypothetical protein MIMGU_mgv1a020887mg [Erythranthe guttata]|eukprot:XP_012845142.1 PREDICTED: putative F-box/LRR-repeat protein At5g02700 [Erythranthe guttata]
MKKAKGEHTSSDSVDTISELPKDILHRIMYFLTQEEAVRTSVLSKPWRYIWCTRPVLNFSDAAFKGNKQEFVDVIDKNLQRYYDQRLCVDEFHLRISKGYLNHESYYLLEKWIRTLTVIGTKKFRLSNRTENGFVYYVPPVVFEARSLEDLHVEICTSDEKEYGRIVFSKHLKKLHLEKIYIRDEVFHKAISIFPFAAIETMSLDSCEGLRNVNITNLRNLKNFSFCTKPLAYDHEERCSIEIHPPSLETVKITFGNLRFRRGADFRSLNKLYLFGVKSKLDQLSSCKFPSLKVLTMHYCYELKETKLFIDAPNIVKFRYLGEFIPSISFATTSSRHWSSQIHLRPKNGASSSLWFQKLKELLDSLGQSNFFLFIVDNSENDEGIIIQDGGCEKKHVVVESLGIQSRLFSTFSSLLNGAFSICRPRNIGGYDLGRDNDNIECVRKILMQRESENQLDQFSQMWLRDLEDVSLEVYDKNRNEWIATSVSELPNFKETEYNYIRFALKWR